MPIKVSQLPLISSAVKNEDLIEISQYVGNNSYISLKATLEDLFTFFNIASGTQAGMVQGSLFSNNPLMYGITLPQPYPDTSYIITVTGEDLRMWSITNKNPSSFIISSNSNVPLMGIVYWKTDGA